MKQSSKQGPTFGQEHSATQWIAEPTQAGLRAIQQTPQIDDFKVWLSQLRPLINDALTGYLQQHCETSLQESARYALDLDAHESSYAKRLRPALTLMVAQSVGADLVQAMPFALACELLHCFTLVHDDIQDGDRTRRGKPSAWVQFGVAEALNLGDYLFALSLRILLNSAVPAEQSERQLALVQELSLAMECSGAGQSRDIASRDRKNLSLSDYLEIVELKTASLLACALCGGAHLGAAGEESLTTLREICLSLMPAYQIVDDLLDLSPQKGRDEIGNDIREGKRSFLVLHTSSQCTDFERDRMYSILDMDRSVTEASDVQSVISLFTKYNAQISAQGYVKQLLGKASNRAQRLPAPLAHNMKLLIDFMSQRGQWIYLV